LGPAKSGIFEESGFWILGELVGSIKIPEILGSGVELSEIFVTPKFVALDVALVEISML
jgi:hypothetical protein